MQSNRPVTLKQLSSFAAAALCLFWARPTGRWLVIGLPLVVLGELVRIWGTGHLRKNETVVTTGPYSYIRDPLYLGTLLISTGVTLAARVYELLALLWLLFFVYYMPYKRRREGDRLARLFGPAYEEYRKKVGSLIPRLRPYRGPDWGTRWSARLMYENSEVSCAILVWLFYMLLVIKWGWFSDLIFPAWRLL